MKLKELLQSIKDDYAMLELEWLDYSNNEFIPMDLYDDEKILSKLEHDIEQDDKEEPEEEMEGD
tara:strand:+ start:37 stop:228 length:192 start_codon:yes stop_codon:yes gene_type:complete